MDFIRTTLFRVAALGVIIFFVLAIREFFQYWNEFPASGLIKTYLILAITLVVFLLRFLSPYLARVGTIQFWSVVLIIFLVSRLVWLFNIPTLPTSDFYYYYQVACDVALGKGLVAPVTRFQNGWGYQLFLGFFFRFFGCDVTVGKALNVVLSLITLPLLYSLVVRFGGRLVGYWAVILFTLWPAHLMYSSVLATEHLALPLVLAGFFFGVRLLDQSGNPWLNAILCGLFLTLGTIVRPAVVVYIVVLVLSILLAGLPVRRSVAQVSILIATFLMLNLAYYQGLKVFNHGIVPLASYSTAANIFYGSSLKGLGQWTPEDAKIVRSWPEESALQYSLTATWQRVSTYTPKKILELLNRKNFEFWGQPYFALNWSTLELDVSKLRAPVPINNLTAWLYLYNYFLLCAAIVASIGLLWNEFTPKLFAAFGILVMGTLLHLVFVVSSRYSYSYTPALFVLSSLWLSVRVSDRRRSLPYASVVKSQPMNLDEYNAIRINHWDQIARHVDRWRPWNRYYHRRLSEIYRFLIPPGMRVLELGSGSGDILAAVKPSCGLGVDFSSLVVERARQEHPELTFIQADVHTLDLDEKFDFIILSDLIDDAWDVEQIFKQARKYCTPKTRLIINYYSRVWGPILSLTESLELSKPRLPQNWLVIEDVTNLLYLAGFEVLRHQREILWPLPLRPLEIFFNRFLAKIWPFTLLDLTNFTIARLIPQEANRPEEPLVSVIVPARNEAGNIPNIFARVPEIGRGTELIFVEGHSQDNTYEAIQQAMAHSSRNCKLFRQAGVGKGDAVRLGFSQASGEVLMILDADLTVAPEDLPKFYEVLATGKGDLANGVRLVYPMQEQAMRFLNFIGNKFFGWAFTWLLGQPIKDTLCGTKALWRSDYERIIASRGYFGDFDPFGDFDLLFGAAKLNCKIVDMPIRYRERAYGATNIQRWRHGWLLLRMVAFAALRIKFV